MRCRTPLRPRARPITFILMDVDGVMTEGGITYFDQGAEAKTFDAKDGVGLWIARRVGLRTGVISGRSGGAVRRRVMELKMDEAHFESRDKLSVYREIRRRRRLSDTQICYIGDDLVDLPVLARAGLPVAVANAHPEVLRRAPFVTRAPGGRGAIREVIDAILKAQGRWKTVMEWFEPSDDERPGEQTAAGRRRR